MKDDDSSNPSKKRARQGESSSPSSAKKTMELLDLASKFGLQDGDRIQVAWQVGDEAEMHWWGASILAWEQGDIVEECVAVRQLK